MTDLLFSCTYVAFAVLSVLFRSASAYATFVRLIFRFVFSVLYFPSCHHKRTAPEPSCVCLALDF